MPKLIWKSYLRFDRILFYLTVLLVVFIPLYPKFPLANVTGTFVAIRLEDVLIALTTGVWLIVLIKNNQIKDLLKDKLIQVMLLFFFVGLVSIYSAIFVTNTVTPTIGILHYLRRVELMLLLPIALTAVRSKRQLIILLIVLGIVVLLVNFYALGQQFLGWKVVSTTNSEFSKGMILTLTPDARVNSTFAGHYDLAIFLVMTLSICSAIFFALRHRLLQIGIIILSGLSFVVLVMTAARQSFLAAVVGVFLSLVFTNQRKFIFFLLVAAVLALAYPSQLRDRFISTIMVNIQQGGERYEATPDEKARNRLNISTLPQVIASKSAEQASATAHLAPDIAPGEPTDPTQLGVYRSFAIRLNVEWPRAIRAFEKNPLLGTGYSSIGLATDNDFLRSFGEVGLLGTAAFALVLIESSKRVWKNFKNERSKLLKYFSAGVLSMIIVIILNAIFIDVFEASKIASLFWLVLGINLVIPKFTNEN